MTKEISVETLCIRDAVKQVLSKATQPMSIAEIMPHDEVTSLKLDQPTVRVTGALNRWFLSSRNTEIGRNVEHTPFGARVVWFLLAKFPELKSSAAPTRRSPNKKGNKLKAKSVAPAPAAPVVPVAPDFTFNPLPEFLNPPTPATPQPAPAPAPQPEVTRNASSVTITLPGITVRIDLTS